MDRPSTKRARPAILVHGGAWATPEDELDAHRIGVHRASMVGFEILLTGGSSVDAVQKVVEFLEADPTFNAGRGSVLNARGEVELDAAIMEGTDLKAGSVAAVSGVLHPVLLAREVLEHSQHVMLAGEGAREFARGRGIPLCDPEELIVERERERFLRARRIPPSTSIAPSETVGAVACDGRGQVAAASSTGGTFLKLPGRIGDSPIVGAGLYCGRLEGSGRVHGQGRNHSPNGDGLSRRRGHDDRHRTGGGGAADHPRARISNRRSRRAHCRRLQGRAGLCLQHSAHGVRLPHGRNDEARSRNMKGASYREVLPAPSLRRFVECYWFLQAPEDAQPDAEPILPDGCMELVLSLGASFQRCHEDGRVEPQPSRMLVGQMDHAVTVRAGGPVDVVGVRFHPSGAHPLFRFSMGSLANRLVPLAEAVDLPDFLAGEIRIHERKRALDANLIPRFERSMQSDSGLERAIASVVEAEGRIGVDRLAQDMGIGPRQLERMFRERVGIGPKRFARILRFQSVFRTLASFGAALGGARARLRLL